MNIVIKKMETDAEIKGKAYVHWISAKKLLFVGRIMSSSQKTAIPLLDSSALANIAMTNSRTPEKFLLFIFYRSITEKALGIA